MDVLSTIVTLFIEMLLTVVSVAAFAYFVKEYHARRTPFLAWFATVFAAQALVMASLFFGQVLAAYGHAEGAARAFTVSILCVSFKGLFVIVGLADLLVKKRRLFYRVAGVLAFAAGAAAVFTGSSSETVAAGMSFMRYESWSLAAVFGTWIVSSAMLVMLPGANVLADVRAKREPSVTDRLLLNAGLLGVSFILLSVVSTVLGARFLIVVNLALLLCHLVLLGIGVAASEHPDPAIRKHPFTIFSRSLVFKAVGLNAFILWTLALALLAITSTYFVSSSVESRRANLRRDLHYFTKSYSSYSMALLEETSRFAALHDVVTSFERPASPVVSEMPEIVSDFLRKRKGSRILRVIDADGVIVYSSYSSEEHGQHMATSRVLEKALAGRKVAAIEKEDAFGVWTVRAGAPIKRDDGSIVGVILDTDVGAAFDFSDYAAISPISAAGYGFVSEAAEQVYTSGQEIDALTRSVLRRQLGPGKLGMHQADGALYLVERVYATDGVPNGFFYIYLTNAMLDSEVFRIISVVTMLVVLAVVFMTGILLFGMTIVLRPIQELRAAARRVENEERADLRIAYKSPDELGQLANAFNHMQETIVDRTAKLREALREQQDFLDHTTRELRTPLNIFRWTLELMRYGDTGRLNKEQLELIEQLNQTNERLMKMVKNLQDAIRIDQRRLALKIEDIVIEDVIDEVAGVLAVASRKKGLALHWNRPKTPLPPVYADRAYLYTVLMNLMGNAVKYTSQNGHIEVDLEETNQASPDGRRGKFLMVTIEDNGIGIPKDEVDRVFTRFFRARNAVGGEIEGTGLGLFITKQIVELHGGAIWFDSREGVGTTVRFTVPIEKPASPPPAETERSA